MPHAFRQFMVLAGCVMAFWPAAASGANLVKNPGFELDADGNGRPDSWMTAGDATCPKGSYSGKAKGSATVSSTAHSGAASFCYHVPAPRDRREEVFPELWDFTAWQEERKAPGKRFFYSTPLVSEEFALEYPKVYRLRAWIKAEEVSGLHLKLIGVPSKGKAQWIGRFLTPEGYSGKTGSWDWERWEGFLLANRGGTWRGRIEVWIRENLAEGRIWIDDVSVEEVDSEGRGVQPILRGAGRHTTARPSAASQPAQAEQTPTSLPQVRVKQEEGRLLIHFKNGTSVTFSTKDPGIGAVSVRGTELRQAASPPMHPLIETQSGGRYEKCRFLDWNVTADSMIVNTELVEKETGQRDKLSWIFKPAALDVHERHYTGFQYAFQFASDTNSVIGVWDRSAWAPGGSVEGMFLRVPGGVMGMPRANAISRRTGIEGRPVIPFLCSPSFDFAGRTNTGLLAMFLDSVAHSETWVEKGSGENQVRHLARHFFTASRNARTPFRTVVFSACKELDALAMEDEWTWVHDVVTGRYRQHVGMTDSPLVPTVRLGAPWWHTQDTEEADFETFNPVLPRVRELGYQAVMLDPIWRSLDRQGNRKPGRCSLTELEVTEAWGDERSLRRFVDEAHAIGLKVIVWAPTALNRRDSDLLRGHPEWMCRKPDSEPLTYGGPGAYLPGRELTYVNLQSGYHDYSIRRYKHFREQIGVDGLWQDSFSSLGKLHYDGPARFTSHLLAGVKRQATLQRLGYGILNIEGRGPFGTVSTSSAGSGAMLARGGRRDYRTSKYYYWGLGPNTYYRCIANKATPMLPFRESDHPHWQNRSVGTNEALTNEVARANKDYAAVAPYMARRFLIPSRANPHQEIGVLWLGPEEGTEVLFAYGHFTWEVGDGRHVRDVTTGQEAELEGGLLRAEPRHTYLIREGHLPDRELRAASGQ